MSAPKDATAGVKVEWRAGKYPIHCEAYFEIWAKDTTNGRLQEDLFRIAGFRPTETEARSACCGLLTMLSLHLGIPASAMEEVR